MSIVARLALLFIAVPLLELLILIRLGGAIGLMPTLALCVLTGVAGAWLARREGLRALWSFQTRLARGGVPGRALMDGMCILIGGAVLLTPGLLTDLLGFALLLPPSRRWIQTRMKRRIERQLADGSLRVTTFGGFPGAGAQSGAGGAQSGPGGASGWGFGTRRGPFGAEADSGDEAPRSRPGEIIQERERHRR